MKKLLVTSLVLVGALVSQARAHEIDSRVIHHYTFLGLGYSYIHDLIEDELNAHGVVGIGSFEQHNVVLTLAGGYFWGDDDLGVDADVNLGNFSTSLGYVVRLAENHINIIPRFGAAWNEITFDAPGFPEEDFESWSIFPGVGVSYAINNRIAVGGSYAYGYNLDSEEDAHLFSAGPTIALLERVGLSIAASFNDEIGWSGVTAGIEFHF